MTCPLILLRNRFRRKYGLAHVVTDLPRLLGELAEILSNLKAPQGITKANLEAAVGELRVAGQDIEDAATLISELLDEIDDASFEVLETAVDRADREYRQNFPWRLEAAR